MLTFSIDNDNEHAARNVTLLLPFEDIVRADLSVAGRSERNRTLLYQRKHAGSALATRGREPALAQLNQTIPEHYQRLVTRKRVDADAAVLAFSISDLTANLLRPHYDASIDADRIVHEESVIASENGAKADVRLFHLKDEPIGEVPYTLLCCYEEGGAIRFAILHDIAIGPSGLLPREVSPAIRSGLKWWAACPPLLASGRHDLEAFAVRDHDLRHVFGFPESATDEEAIRQMYRSFPDWSEWSLTIRARLATIDSFETGYQAALGIGADQLILLHRTATIPDLARDLRALGADNGVLLDSGGSCAIWANWAHDGHDGILASHWNFRPRRGAVIFLTLSDYAKTCFET